jgi:AbiU2
MAHVLENVSEKIPENTRRIFSLLSGEVIWLREKWLNYNYLFGHSPERIEVLNQCGATFFYTLDHLFIDDFILTLSRLTDPAKARESNLSLEQLIVMLDKKVHSELIQKLIPLLESLRDKTASVRKHRNKRIAHGDFNAVVKPDDVLPAVSRQMIENALLEAESFLNVFDFYFTGAELLHDTLAIQNGSDVLFEKLLKALEYEKLERDGKIPEGAWRNLKSFQSL